MSHLCSKLPRHEVSHYWSEALRGSLDELDDGSETSRLLVCHLTLFSPVTREMYIPCSPGSFVETGDGLPPHEVERVVVLIDDIYDMYARLSGSGGVLNEEQHKENYANHIHALDGLDLRATAQDDALLSFEVRVRTLEFLAGWRRAELLQAEMLANTLGAPLTVLGAKHSLAALQRLVVDPSVRSAYLSHKITDPRIANRQTPGQWMPLVDEVNSLSGPLLAEDIVLIHPTAIDELRMATWSGNIGLTDRWPLQNPDSDTAPRDGATSGLAYLTPDRLDPPDYLELFDATALGSGDTAMSAKGRFRGFEMSIFEEISARDHLLVSYSDALVLYRPVIFGVDSSGARSEVNHWQQRWRSASPAPTPSSPRLVSLHVYGDIDERLIRLTLDERSELKQRIKNGLEEENLDPTQAAALVAGLVPRSTHLHALSGAENHEASLEYASKEALHQLLLNWVSNVTKAGARNGAALIASGNESSLREPETVALVAAVIDGRGDPIFTTAGSITRYIRHTSSANATELCSRLLALSSTADAARTLGVDRSELEHAVPTESLINALHGHTQDELGLVVGIAGADSDRILWALGIQ